MIYSDCFFKSITAVICVQTRISIHISLVINLPEKNKLQSKRHFFLKALESFTKHDINFFGHFLVKQRQKRHPIKTGIMIDGVRLLFSASEAVKPKQIFGSAK